MIGFSNKDKVTRKKEVKPPTHTKVIIKVCVEPINCPLSLCPEEKYEYSLEYLYPSTQLNTTTPCVIDGMKVSFDKVETNLVDNTFFALKEKHYPVNFERLSERLGYRPDKQEFWEKLDHYLKFLVTNIRNHQLQNADMIPSEDEVLEEIMKVA